MTLKHILLTSIAAVSLSGSLYGMDRELYDPLMGPSDIDKITCANPGKFFDLISNDDEESNDYDEFIEKITFIVKHNPFIVNVIIPNSPDHKTALDLAIEQNRPDLLEIFLSFSHYVNINGSGKNRLHTAITMDCGDGDDDFDLNKQVIHLLCSGGATMESGDDQPYGQDPHDALTIAEYAGNDDILAIIHRYIHSRLAQAILNNNVNEVQRIITKYNIDINQSLPCYSYYTITFLSSKPTQTSFIPLHTATEYNQHDVTRFLINTLNANVAITNHLGQTALHDEPDLAIAQLLMEKGCNPNMADITGRTPIDNINHMLTADMLAECNHQPERIEKFRALKDLFENRPNIPADNMHAIGNNAFSWKLIGGGAVVVVAAIAAKKLYTWWYKEADVTQEETSDADTQHPDQQDKDADKNKTTTQG